jgi:hypothetical protein
MSSSLGLKMESSDEWWVDLNSVKINGEEAKARESHLSGAYPE